MQIQKLNVEIALVFNNLFRRTVFNGSAHRCISSYCTLYLQRKNAKAMIHSMLNMMFYVPLVCTCKMSTYD